jgi:hypothetical protein
MMMKKLFLRSCTAAALCFLFANSGMAVPIAPPIPPMVTLGDIATDWPGIHYQMLRLKRIPPNRLLVVLYVVGLEGTPPGGVYIKGPDETVPGVKPGQTATRTGFFSFDPSVMTDLLTNVAYPVLPSIAPPGKVYRSSRVIFIIQPGRGNLVDMQFACPPPPPPPAPGQPPPKQFLSFVFPKGKTAMKVELPPPDAAAINPGAKPAGGG